jgi:hypothetical protein
MDEHFIDMAVTAASVEEVGHPRKAVGSRGGGRASKSVTLVGKRPEVLVPNTDSRGRISLGLRAFIDLVETKGVGSITGLSELDKTVDLVFSSAPEHDTDGNASVLDRGGNLRVPKMEHLDALGSGEKSNPLVIAHSPGNSELSGTGGSVGRRLCLNGFGRIGSRRENDVLRGIGLGRVVLRRVRVLGGVGVLRRLGSIVGWFGRLGLASLLVTTLLLGNSVMVREVPSQMVRLDRNREGLGGSERTEEDSECG